MRKSVVDCSASTSASLVSLHNCTRYRRKMGKLWLLKEEGSGKSESANAHARPDKPLARTGLRLLPGHKRERVDFSCPVLRRTFFSLPIWISSRWLNTCASSRVSPTFSSKSRLCLRSRLSYSCCAVMPYPPLRELHVAGEYIQLKGTICRSLILDTFPRQPQRPQEISSPSNIFLASTDL
jgi:hypothetical protein